MHDLPFFSTLRSDKTLAAALSFIVLFGAAELVAVDIIMRREHMRLTN